MKNEDKAKLTTLLTEQGIEGVHDHYEEKSSKTSNILLLMMVINLTACFFFVCRKNQEIYTLTELVIYQDSANTYLQNNRITSADTSAILFHGLTQGVINKHKAKK